MPPLLAPFEAGGGDRDLLRATSAELEAPAASAVLAGPEPTTASAASNKPHLERSKWLHVGADELINDIAAACKPVNSTCAAIVEHMSVSLIRPPSPSHALEAQKGKCRSVNGDLELPAHATMPA